VRAKYRVVQWATGNIGTKSLQGVIEHPAMELVGVYVYGADKVGRDVGGLTATSSIDDILDLDAECILYMPRACDFDEVCRLLASGANIVTTRGEFHRPASLPDDVRARVEAACQEGRTSIHSTGSSPGFITEAVPLVLTSIQRRLDLVSIEESADLSQRDSPELLFDLMGFGGPPEALHGGRLEHLLSSFGPSLQLTAESLGMPLDSLEVAGEVAVAARTIEIAAGTLEAGTVAAQRTTVSGMRNGRPLMKFQATWYCTAELDPAWEVHRTGWRIVVDGDAPLAVDLPFPFPLEEMAQRSPGYTANRAVNAVPYVITAAPGIRTSVDLPQIIARLG
jgi:4-hydroxy-tetrahydrodipicolinate reductase